MRSGERNDDSVLGAVCAGAGPQGGAEPGRPACPRLLVWLPHGAQLFPVGLAGDSLGAIPRSRNLCAGGVKLPGRRVTDVLAVDLVHVGVLQRIGVQLRFFGWTGSSYIHRKISVRSPSSSWS
jgi:hypothetical protein